MSLLRTLTLNDLTLFGVASIMGSGGFNLIGEAVRSGGSLWPVACGIASALLLGASHTYSRMYDTGEKGNTMESDLVSKLFGTHAEYITIAGILVFNIVSISVILVLCSHTLFPDGTWLGQITFALVLLAGMAMLGLQGIDTTKNLVNTATVGLLICLTAVASIGFLSLFFPSVVTSKAQNSPISFKTSLLLFFFVLAGFDVLTKFTKEVKDSATIPQSFFASNILSDILTFGIAIAIFNLVPLTKANQDNAFGHIFEKMLGDGIAEGFKPLMVVFMVVTTFIMFLSISRNVYGLGENFKLQGLTSLNEAKAPHIAIGAVTLMVALGILNNHTDTLVTVSNVGLIVTILLVSAGVTVVDWKAGKLQSATLSGLTTAGFGGLLAMCFI